MKNHHCRRHHPQPKPRVRVFLDVNGVLDAMSQFQPDCWPLWRRLSHRGSQFLFATGLADALGRMADLEGVELVWLTTYGDYANDSIGKMMGLPTMRALEPPASVFKRRQAATEVAHEWWKLRAIRKASADEVPFIWADDQLFYSRPAVEWLNGLDLGSRLALCPDGGIGLTPENVAEMANFLALHLDTSNVRV